MNTISDRITKYLTGCFIEIVKPTEANPVDIKKWWEIYAPCHLVGGVEFLERFMNFDQVVFIRDSKSGIIVGGSGFRIRTFDLKNNKTVKTIYLGQSYILPEYRGRKLMSLSYTQVVLDCKKKHPFRQIWFWMDALSYKPYLIMANQMREYYPSSFRKTPDWVKDLRSKVGLYYYMSLYDDVTGVVKKKERRLKPSEGKIRQNDLNNPFIRFYLRLNPGHVRGEGLLCVCPGNFKNVLWFTWLLIKQSIGKPNENHKN